VGWLSLHRAGSAGHHRGGGLRPAEPIERWGADSDRNGRVRGWGLPPWPAAGVDSAPAAGGGERAEGSPTTTPS